MDPMLDAFWRSWPWPLMVLVILLLSGGITYIAWLSNENWLEKQADNDSCDLVKSEGSNALEQIPEIQQDGLEKNLRKKSANA